MVRVTGKSPETLYRYLDGEIGGKAPASHEHTQAQVTGLPDALNGKAAVQHGHAQTDVAGLTAALGSAEGYHHLAYRGYCKDANEAIQMGIYITAPDTANAGQYGILICWVSDAGIYNGSTNWLYQELRGTTGQICCRQKINDGDFTGWTWVFKQGDSIAARQSFGCGGYREITVPTTGWVYESWRDAYYLDIAQPGMTYGAHIYAACEVVGTNFPLLSVQGITDIVRVWMADIPAYAGTIYCDFFGFL